MNILSEVRVGGLRLEAEGAQGVVEVDRGLNFTRHWSRAVDQSVVDFWTVAGGVASVIGSIVIGGLGLLLRESYLKPKISVLIKPIWIKPRGRSMDLAVEGHFRLKYPTMEKLLGNLELMEMVIHNPRSYSVRLDNLGILIQDENPPVSWWKRAMRKRRSDGFQHAIKESSEFSVSKWDLYEGGSVEIPAYSTLRFVFNIWPHLEGLMEGEHESLPARVRGYASMLGRLRVSSRRHSFMLTGLSRSFSTPVSIPGFKFYLLRYLSVFAEQPIDVGELDRVGSEIMASVKESYLDSITYGDISQAEVFDVKNPESIIGYHLSDIAEDNQSVLNLTPEHLGGIVLALTERGLIEDGLIHEDFLADRKEIVAKTQIRILGDLAPHILIVS